MTPPIFKNTKRKGGFCVVKEEYVDGVNYIRINNNFGVVFTPYTQLETTVGLGRNNHSAVVYGDRMYVYGGDTGSHTDEVWEYDFVADNWTLIGTGAPERQGHRSVQWGGKMYTFGGNTIGTVTVNEMYEWDFSGTWNYVSTVGTAPTPRYLVGMEVYDDKIWIFGGDNTSTTFDDLFFFNPQTDAWTSRASMPTTLTNFSTVVYGNKMYVYGGSVTDGGISTNTFWEYDFDSNQWTVLTSGPVSLAGHTATIVGDEMFIFGATNLWVYNFTKLEWRQKTDIPVVKSEHTAVVYSNKTYLFDGTEHDGTLYAYDIDSDPELAIRLPQGLE
jgi:N-acetylneuraminic acid mutarotase